MASDARRIFPEDVGDDGRKFTRLGFRIPRGVLSTVLEEVEYTTWVVEPLIEEKLCFTGCSVDTTRSEVRRCFEEAGLNGRFILSPSDQFLDARPELVHAFADEAAHCRY